MERSIPPADTPGEFVPGQGGEMFVVQNSQTGERIPIRTLPEEMVEQMRTLTQNQINQLGQVLQQTLENLAQFYKQNAVYTYELDRRRRGVLTLPPGAVLRKQ